ESVDRGARQADGRHALGQGEAARLPVDATVDQGHTGRGLDGVAVDPGGGLERERGRNQVDAVAERPRIRNRPVHPCSTESRMPKVMSTVTSKSVGVPESSTLPPARTMSQRVMSAMVVAARARTVRTAS